jgi:hypothetical protein
MNRSVQIARAVAEQLDVNDFGAQIVDAELDLILDVQWWWMRRREGFGHDPSCVCHDWTNMNLRAAVKKLRAYRKEMVV